MYPEKQSIVSSEHIEEGQENRPMVTLDFRRLSLATLISALASVAIVAVCSFFKQSQMKRFALGGAFLVLSKADSAASLIAVVTAIANVQIGSRRVVEVLPRKSSGLVRVLVIAVVVGFLRGGLDFFIPELIYGWDQFDANVVTDLATDMATDLTKVSTDA